MLQAILALLLSLPAYHADHESPDARLARMTVVAQAIQSAVDESTCTGPFEHSDWCKVLWPGDKRALAALLVTIGWHESSFALHVGANQCGPHECDGREARHYWQGHVNPWVSPDTWEQMAGIEPVPTTIAAEAATRVLAAGVKRCGTEPDRLISWYANHRCRWPGAERRMTLYRRSRDALRTE